MRPPMPQDAGFIDAQRRHFTIGQLNLHKAALGKRQRTHCARWKYEMTGKSEKTLPRTGN